MQFHRRRRGGRPRPGGPLLLIAVACTVLVAGAVPEPVGAGEREVRVYRVQHRAAAELVPVAEAVIGEAGSATLNVRTNSVLLVGEAEGVEQALDVLRRQDTALRTIVVHYGMQDTAGMRGAGVHLRWSASAGGFRIGNVVRPDAGDAVAFAAYERWRRGQHETKSTLRVLPGSRSRIEVGTSVPYTTSSQRGTSTTWVNAGSGFVAEARIVERGRVRLALDPFQALLGPDAAIQRSSASATLVLSPGEIKVLGGIDRARDARRHDLAADASSGERSGERLLLVWVELD